MLSLVGMFMLVNKRKSNVIPPLQAQDDVRSGPGGDGDPGAGDTGHNNGHNNHHEPPPAADGSAAGPNDAAPGDPQDDAALASSMVGAPTVFVSHARRVSWLAAATRVVALGPGAARA